MSSDALSSPEAPVRGDEVMRRILIRVMPLPVLLGLICIIDRTNIAYASLQMNEDLGLSATAYGFGAGILFFGYFLLEVPSNLALRRFGAGRWLARIAITWGIVSGATAFVWDEASFFVLRFLLGVAEAGLFPGVVLYLTYWFPRQYRGRAMALFMACIPISSIVGGPVSGLLLTADGFLGLRGWQLIFLVEALPAVVLGLLAAWFLLDSPDRARWLSDAERRWLVAQLQREEGEAAPSRHDTIGAALRNRYVWLFTIMYFCFACNSYGVSFFLPRIAAGFQLTEVQVGLVSAVPYAVGLVAMLWVGRRSDRTGERRLHFAVPMVIGGLGLLGTGLALSVPILALLFASIAVAGLMSALGTFWPRPTALLSGTVAVAGIALINSFGNIGGFVGPYVFGFLTDLSGGGYTLPLLFLTALALLGGALAFAVRAAARHSA